jgi:hypothetical protein
MPNTGCRHPRYLGAFQVGLLHDQICFISDTKPGNCTTSVQKSRQNVPGMKQTPDCRPASRVARFCRRGRNPAQAACAYGQVTCEPASRLFDFRPRHVIPLRPARETGRRRLRKRPPPSLGLDEATRSAEVGELNSRRPPDRVTLSGY